MNTATQFGKTFIVCGAMDCAHVVIGGENVLGGGERPKRYFIGAESIAYAVEAVKAEITPDWEGVRVFNSRLLADKDIKVIQREFPQAVFFWGNPSHIPQGKSKFTLDSRAHENTPIEGATAELLLHTDPTTIKAAIKAGTRLPSQSKFPYWNSERDALAFINNPLALEVINA